MNKMLAIGVGAVLLLLLLVFSTTYTVSFHEVAIKRTMGKSDADDVSTDPGLKFKLPIVQDEAKYDTRLQILESPLEEIALSDGQQVAVKAYLLWRVDPGDALTFDSSYGSIEAAERAMRDPFTAAMGGALSKRGFDQLVGPNHELAQAEMEIKNMMAVPGITADQVGISQIMLPERTSNTVVRRMDATRARLAEALRTQGVARAQAITSGANTDSDKILAFADAHASNIRSQGQEKARDYMERMSDEEELAIFLAWLDALEVSLSTNTSYVLDGNVFPWHVLNPNAPVDQNGIPVPSSGFGTPGVGE
ncbi:MAG: SPFH domain-containing protein [Planctomycetota bacterium]|jgi:membrane protease subunit HflC